MRKRGSALTFLAGGAAGIAAVLWLWPEVFRTVFTAMARRFLRRRVMPMPYHLLDKRTLRSFMHEAPPLVRLAVTDPFLENIQSVIQETQRTHLQAAQNPPASDTAVVHYLAQTGLLEEIGLDTATALGEIRGLDASLHHLQPKSPFTEYHGPTPPAAPVRLPGEFEPIGAVILAWPVFYPYRWRWHAEFAAQVTTEAEAHILVPNAFWQKGVELYLRQRQIPLQGIRFLHIPTDDVWTRDYGPTVVLRESDGQSLVIANPYAPRLSPYTKSNNEVPLALGRYYGVPVHRLPLVMEGGNIHSDGQGTFILFDATFARNPDVSPDRLEDMFRRFFGAKRLIVLPTLTHEGTGHIDMAVKFLDVDSLLVAQSRPGQRWHGEFEALAEQLGQMSSSSGRRYRIVRGPIVEDRRFQFHFWSYINSLTLNSKVIIPRFGVETDRLAQRIYQEHMPGYEIVAIDFRDFPVGASHCQSKEVPLPLVLGLRP